MFCNSQFIALYEVWGLKGILEYLFLGNVDNMDFNGVDILFKKKDDKLFGDRELHLAKPIWSAPWWFDNESEAFVEYAIGYSPIFVEDGYPKLKYTGYIGKVQSVKSLIRQTVWCEGRFFWF